MDIYKEIKKLAQYGIAAGIVSDEDYIYTVNRILECMGLVDYTDPDIGSETIEMTSEIESIEMTSEIEQKASVKAVRHPECDADVEGSGLTDILNNLTDYAYEKGIITSNDITTRDIFDTRLMGLLTPPPSVCIKKFQSDYEEDPAKATDNFYAFSKATNYIRTDRIKKDLRWKTASVYGDIDININLSKPEKDPKAIAAMRNASDIAYPKCQLCIENEGYGGRVDHPARQNHRVMPLSINGKKWGFQYSPYVYFNEHCIVFNNEHVPMKIDHEAFVKLFDFIDLFPHYFLGSNADLPIVGGSILTHDHFQGGNYTFAMEKAEIEKYYRILGYEDVRAGILNWPVSVIRISHENRERLIDLADHILKRWRRYTDEEAMIFAYTDGVPHNTITPIVRKNAGNYEMDLALRNNITTEEYPLGLYHPHPKYHHIKKENIGLIEVMGQAILPARLKKMMDIVEACVARGEDFSNVNELMPHMEWLNEIFTARQINSENVRNVLMDEIGKIFVKVLEDAGVYKCTAEGRAAFERFMESL